MSIYPDWLYTASGDGTVLHPPTKALVFGYIFPPNAPQSFTFLVGNSTVSPLSFQYVQPMTTVRPKGLVYV
jgi:hypothetical protein